MMIRLSTRGLAPIAALGLLLLPAIAPAADPIALFDGKSLDGWTTTGTPETGTIRVENGAILIPVGRPMTGITTTRKDLPTTNYELSYEAQRLDGSDFFAAATFPVGKSFITFVNGGWGGSVTGLSSLNGADASENDSSTYFVYKNKTVYKFRIRVTDKTIQCAIDGKAVVNVNHADRQVSTRIETRVNQPLGFSAYNSTGSIRKVEVRKLSAEEIAATDKEG